MSKFALRKFYYLLKSSELTFNNSSSFLLVFCSVFENSLSVSALQCTAPIMNCAVCLCNWPVLCELCSTIDPSLISLLDHVLDSETKTTTAVTQNAVQIFCQPAFQSIWTVNECLSDLKKSISWAHCSHDRILYAGRANWWKKNQTKDNYFDYQ